MEFILMINVAISKDSFKSTKRFYDDKNYPKGISRSGDYTLNETQILEEYGVALKELSIGIRIPVTNDEQHFVDVCHGRAEVESVIEKTWVKYNDNVLTPKQFHTLFGRTKALISEEEIEEISVNADSD